MKVRIEAECTPEEARAFLGLPDVTPINDKLVGEITRRMETNSAALKPEELMRSWMMWGGQAQEQFRSLMTTVLASTATSGGRASDDKAE